MCASRGSGKTELKTAGEQTSRQRDERTEAVALRGYGTPTPTHLVQHAGAGAAVGNAMQDGNSRF